MGTKSKKAGAEATDAELANAVRDAVSRSKAEAEARLASLEEKRTAWHRKLEAVDTPGLEVEREGLPSVPLSIAVAEGLDEALANLQVRARHLDHINIVMFGRTGAGKSSFVEAVTRGSGSRVSPDGRLDHTREIEETDWLGIKLVDTPGVEGWAEAADRAEIEEKAHLAVERADLVVLMFDDYNQKIGEFQQVGRWVTALGKAAIAVLNIRDDGWRFDSRLFHESDKEASAQSVREHYSHTSKMLAEFGLADAPVVAVNLAWAFGARATSVDRHPAAADLRAELTAVGTERLAEISNLPPLLEVITRLLSEKPEALRLGTLHREEKTALDHVHATLEQERNAVALRIDQAERVLTACLQATGLPTDKELKAIGDTSLKASLKEFKAHLGESSVSARGSNGETEKILGSHLDLSACQSQGLKAAQEELQRRQLKKKQVSASDLQEVALTAAEFDSTALVATEAAVEDLVDRLKAEDADFRRDFELEFGDMMDDLNAEYDPSTGSTRRWVGRIGGVGAAAAGAYVVLEGLAVLAGPIGWAAIAATIGASLLFRKLRKSGRRAREEAALKLDRQIQSWLKGVAAEYERQALGQFRVIAWEVAVRSRGATAEQLVGLMGVKKAIESVRQDLRRFANSRVGGDDPSAMLGAALTHVENLRFPEAKDAKSLLWLGEDWLELEWTGGMPDNRRFERPPLGGSISLPELEVAATRKFWDRADDLAREDQRIAGPVAAGRTVFGGTPVIALAGDFSSGKTSLIRRLSIHLGIEIESRSEDLPIGAQPTTEATVLLRGEGTSLCDTPGLNSGNPEHDGIARKAVAGASLIAVLHTPTSGRLDGVIDLLHPDDGLPTRADRAIHVLARIDALSARPHTDPDGFMRLLDAKRTEVADRLANMGIEAHADCPLPVAGDPGGRAAHRPDWQAEDFAGSAGWDGVNDLVEVMVRLAEVGVPLAAIDRTLTDLFDVVGGLTVESAGVERSLVEYERLEGIHLRAMEQLDRVLASARSSLSAIVEGAIAERLEELTGMPKSRIEEIRENPAEWIVDERLNEQFEDWRQTTIRKAAEVLAQLEASVEVRVESRAFREARKSEGFDVVADGILGDLRSFFGEAANQASKEGVEKMAQAASKALTDAVPKLTPYAQQLGNAFARAIAFGGAVAIEFIFQLLEEHLERQRAEEIGRAKEALAGAGAEWVTGTIDGSDDVPGVLDGLVVAGERYISEPLEKIREVLERDRATLDELAASATRAKELIALGMETAGAC